MDQYSSASSHNPGQKYGIARKTLHHNTQSEGSICRVRRVERLQFGFAAIRSSHTVMHHRLHLLRIPH
ncbi:hypothetical protein PsYK624_038980 [Phanerochaete sordida]|uniref:Uncharacterized protein n=1 Tax=Phanerochaete sordida TaxID=48140 RepID=A0A9P3G4Q7_9APHY|nr:hypothetical protein PsYK624_038980 [Phanerochaete sordida]